MYTLWRFLESFKVLRSVTSVSFLMVSAIVVVIATITAIAKIAFEDRSLLAIFLLLVTILQVLEFEKKKNHGLTLFLQPWRNLYMAWVFLLGDHFN